MKLTLSLVLALAASSNAFVHSSVRRPSLSQLHASVATKGQVTAPSPSSDDEASEIYAKNVQTTYG